MEALDRRLDGAVRMPVDLLVQLSHDSIDGEIYDADAVNLGAEGLGLRSAILPDIGQRLRCRFELPDDGGTCETDAQVVWASDTGTEAGEFGVKFDALEPRVQAIVDRWVSTIEGGPPRVITPVSTASPEPKVKRSTGGRGKTAQVHLDGVGSPIEGMITSDDGLRALVAQPLPFLALGKGATLEVGQESDRRALSHVELLVENGVPRLVLTLEKMQREPSARATTKSAPPDLHAPDGTLSEQDQVAAPAEPMRVAKAAASEASEWVTGHEPEAPAPSSIDPAMDDDAPVRASRDLDRMREREPVRAVRVARGEDEPAGEETPSVSLQERVTPHLVKLVAGMRAAWAITIATTGPWAKRAAAWLVQAAKTAATYVREHAPAKMATVLGRAPRRRTTTPPPAAVPGLRKAGRASEAPAAVSPMRGKGRLALAGVMAVVAVGLTAYALSGPAEEAPEAPVVPEIVEAAPVADIVAPEPALMPPPVGGDATAIETGALIPTPPPAEPTPPALVGGHLPAPTFPTLGGSATTSTPTTEEPSAEAPIASAPSTEFGAAEVANGRTSTLRMSQPITSLVGQADESGFTVTIDGALSLDRAGPIAAANPSVERASILNRGDHCVLTVRFIAGRSPAYRVAIRGQAVEVTIGR